MFFKKIKKEYKKTLNAGILMFLVVVIITLSGGFIWSLGELVNSKEATTTEIFMYWGTFCGSALGGLISIFVLIISLNNTWTQSFEQTRKQILPSLNVTIRTSGHYILLSPSYKQKNTVSYLNITIKNIGLSTATNISINGLINLGELSVGKFISTNMILSDNHELKINFSDIYDNHYEQDFKIEKFDNTYSVLESSPKLISLP